MTNKTLTLEKELGLLNEHQDNDNNTKMALKNTDEIIQLESDLEQEKIKQRKLIGETLTGIKLEDLMSDKKETVWSNIKPKISSSVKKNS